MTIPVQCMLDPKGNNHNIGNFSYSQRISPVSASFPLPSPLDFPNPKPLTLNLKETGHLGNLSAGGDTVVSSVDAWRGVSEHWGALGSPDMQTDALGFRV